MVALPHSRRMYSGNKTIAPNLTTRCDQLLARWLIVEQRSIVPM
jgi:hypothetical protein